MKRLKDNSAEEIGSEQKEFVGCPIYLLFQPLTLSSMGDFQPDISKCSEREYIKRNIIGASVTKSWNLYGMGSLRKGQKTTGERGGGFV